MAGRESGAGNPLIMDFTLLGRRLEKLGFLYHRSGVIIIETETAICPA